MDLDIEIQHSWNKDIVIIILIEDDTSIQNAFI